ncbi:MAG: protein kinase [Kofleriaceae bacterium]
MDTLAAADNGRTTPVPEPVVIEAASRSADDSLPTGEAVVIGGRYVVGDLIGAGSFGFVYGAQHLVLGKPVAIKVLRGGLGDSDEAQRFLREARTASQLSHENIISILDFGRDDAADLAYLVMERFTCVSLSDVVRASAPMPASRVIPILVQIARALAAAHAAGVVHRNVTARNVLLGRGDFVKLCDFGLSRPTVLDEPDRDAAGDVYGFGCIAYEMLTGAAPGSSATPARMPAELEDLVMRCLEPNPRDRPETPELEIWMAAVAAGSGRVAASLDPGAQRIGSYDVIRLLGKGGASSVYLCKHPLIGTQVAIKVLHPEIAAVAGMADRFIQEARASGELNSPHIPRYFDFGMLDTGQPYSVIEYLEGETLGQRLAREHRLSLEDTAMIVGQVATAMATVHDAGIIHRDLKPDNLFLTTDANGCLVVKILDFGIAKALGSGGSAAQTSVGLVLGTPYYCAPEQAMGMAVGASADIYALGATAFEMLVGAPPFCGEVSLVMGAKTTRSAPEIRSIAYSVPPSVAATIDRMIEREPRNRIASMREIVDAVAAWDLTPAVNATITTASDVIADDVEPDPPSSGRWRWLVAGLVALAVAGGAVAWINREAAEPSTAIAPPAASVPVASPPPSRPAVTPAPTAPVASEPTRVAAPIDRVAAPIDAAAPPAAAVPESSASPAPAAQPSPAATAKPKKPRRAVKHRGAPNPVPRDDAVIVDPFKDEAR